MDFALPDELQELHDEATQVALKAAADRDFPEDSWIVGHDAKFAKELGARGWLGMTWPVEEGASTWSGLGGYGPPSEKRL